MQQFVVPQFIDVEDKIFGPITTRQFMILLTAAIIVFLAYRLGDFSFFIFILAVVGGLALVFAFVRVNGQTFHYFLLNITQTFRKPSLRVWGKSHTDEELNYYRKEGQLVVQVPIAQRKTVRPQRIRDLALIVNTGGYYKGEEE